MKEAEELARRHTSELFGSGPMTSAEREDLEEALNLEFLAAKSRVGELQKGQFARAYVAVRHMGREVDPGWEAASDASMSKPKPPTVLNETSFWDHQVSSIQFLAGDLGKGSGHLLASGKVRIPGGSKDFSMSAVASVEIASEESVKRVGGALGWGLAGAAIFGPAGLIVGGLLGGKGKDITFAGTLKDGKRFLAMAKSDVFRRFQAATFD